MQSMQCGFTMIGKEHDNMPKKHILRKLGEAKTDFISSPDFLSQMNLEKNNNTVGVESQHRT